MFITRHLDQAGNPVIGIEKGGHISPLNRWRSLGEMLREPLDNIRSECHRASGGDAIPKSEIHILPPIDSQMEVWAAGVTYMRSREARVEESTGAADAYQLVYDAPRPELFFKSASWRVAGDGEYISIRRDSAVNVPEPELALVLNAAGETIGYTICNDVSSRSIEGVNPLYLPQAKVYLGGCAVGPAIRPAWELDDPYSLEIQMTISRAGAVSWRGRANTSELKRTFDELAGYLFREDAFPHGVVLATGTSLVPDLPVTLLPGDRVEIAIEGLGRLTNHVTEGKDRMAWLTERASAVADGRSSGQVDGRRLAAHATAKEESV